MNNAITNSRKHWRASLSVLSVLFIMFFIPSCSLILETSGDNSHVRYHYDYQGNQSIVSTSAGDVGFNLGVLFTLHVPPSVPIMSDYGYNTSGSKPTQYAFDLHEHGPLSSNLLFQEIDFAYQYPYSYKAPSSQPFTNHLGVNGAIEFIGKGGKDGGTKTRLNYLELPLYATYWYHISTGNVFGGIGPYLAYGLGGKIKSSTGSVKSFSTDGGFKRFDAGFSITGGYQITNSFSFRFAYDKGLANVANEGNGGKAKTSSISLNIGYPLQKLIRKIK